MSVSLLEKPASALQETDIQSLLSDAVPESLTLDYKREIGLEQKADRKEFAADVSAFANKSGGYILIGVTESEGVPVSVDGVNVSDLDALKLQIENVLGALVSPKIVGLEIAGIPLSSGDQVIAIRVPASFAAPHAADGRFIGRSAAGKYPMDVVELGSHFRSSAGFADRALAFHRQRRELIAQNRWAVDLDPQSRFLLHVVPRRAFDFDSQVDVAAAETDWPAWLLERKAMGADYRFNFDGLAVYGLAHTGQALEGALLYRNGIYEAIVGGGFWRDESGQSRLAPILFEDLCVENLPPMLNRLSNAGSAPPYVCMVSALGTEGTRVVQGHGLSQHPIDRSILEIPQFQIISIDDDLRSIGRSTFNALWQSGGFACSPSYSATGQWIRAKGP